MKYGLDFGTSNSTISFDDGINITLLPVEKSLNTPEIMPSLLYFEDIEKKWYFGHDAFIEYKENGGDGRFIQSIKKLLADNMYTGTHIGFKFYSLEKLIELYFREIKKRADKIVQKNVKAITIGRPVYFSRNLNDGLAEKRLQTAASRAGFEEIDFVLEPLAATYALKKQIAEPTNVFTIDIGGGTTDVSIVSLMPNGNGSSRILSTHGISVGGIDFTSQIMNNRLLKYFGLGTTYKSIFNQKMPFPKYALRHITDWYNSLKMVHNQQFMSFLKEVKRTTSDPEKIKCLEELVYEKLGLEIFIAIETAKIALSEDMEAYVEYRQNGIDIQELVKRIEFEHYIASYANEISEMMDESLNQGELDYDQMDIVLMVGGSSKIPLLKKIIEDKFPTIPVIQTNIYSSVAYGLSVADHPFQGSTF
ncbi:MAG: Hsp70 family protein [Desulfobacteraceae bacterium]|nr:Hsp70 family protein [Desulfobacteraceae bacterium]